MNRMNTVLFEQHTCIHVHVAIIATIPLTNFCLVVATSLMGRVQAMDSWLLEVFVEVSVVKGLLDFLERWWMASMSERVEL